VVLAAGRGTRMGALTDETPKPMLPVQGRPMLEHILGRLGEAGVERYLLVVGYRREVIQEHFAAGPFAIDYVVQETVNGTGSAARLAREFAGEDPFVLTFGDILVDPSAYVRCGSVMTAYPATKAVLAVKDVDDPWRGAAVYVEPGGRITKVIEKPSQGTSATRWGSAGLYAFTAAVFPYLDALRPSERNEYELTSIFDPMIRDGLELRIAPVDGSWRDVANAEDLLAANREPGR
jgi:NDP-sugar pyrophosphorylase family protein